MHLNKILEQIKRHQSPTEAIDKLATALEKHEGSLLEKGFTILKSELAANMYEAINGPHFDEEHAHYAVEGMENEDGTKGPHWTVEETTSVANQIRSTRYVTRRTHCNLLHCYNNRLLISLVKLDLVRFLLT